MHKELLQNLSQLGYNLKKEQILTYIEQIKKTQELFPTIEQYSLIIQLIESWKTRQSEKILILTNEYPRDTQILPRAVTFGIISSDWPGLSDSCIGVIHEKGWNVHLTRGLSIHLGEDKLGIVIACIIAQTREKYEELIKQRENIISDIRQASVGNITKVYLLGEEIKKLQIYSKVMDKIEELYDDEDLDEIIGEDGEAVKFFAARSRDYIDNRTTEDIAWQIITNYKFQKKVQSLRRHMQVEIRNFSTKKEGEFTGISVAGMTNQINLDDLLSAIESRCKNFQLKHHKDFTTEDGINIHRFEITTETGEALNPSQIELLKHVFKNLEYTKQRERQNWLETIGGFEHYARAIIPFLIKQNKLTEQTQVYLSVLQSTEKVIDFKILIVLTPKDTKTNKLMYQCVHQLDAVPEFYISKVKPPSRYGDSEIIILDLKVNLTINANIESVYQKVKTIIKENFGEFRDFDEGMRQMDLRNFQNVKEFLSTIKESVLREFYYSLEDFYRVSAPTEEIAKQIQLGLEIQEIQSKAGEKGRQLHVLAENLIQIGPGQSITQPASIVVILFTPQPQLLEKILDMFEDYELVMSKLEKESSTMLICRLSRKRQALPEEELSALVERLQHLG